MTNTSKAHVAQKVQFVLKKYEFELKRATPAQRENIEAILEALFSYKAADGYEIPPSFVQVLFLKGPEIILHWRVWAYFAHAAGYRWMFQDLDGGKSIIFWHKDSGETKYEFVMHYKDYEAKIKRWMNTDLEVMICKTLLKNAIAFFAPELAAKEPLALVATFDESDLEPQARPQATAPSLRDQRKAELRALIYEQNMSEDEVAAAYTERFGKRKIDELSADEYNSFLHELRALGF